MNFRHPDHDTKQKNILKLENRILGKGNLLYECCVKEIIRPAILGPHTVDFAKLIYEIKIAMRKTQGIILTGH